MMDLGCGFTIIEQSLIPTHMLDSCPLSHIATPYVIKEKTVCSYILFFHSDFDRLFTSASEYLELYSAIGD
jgi:hypothetical protein